MAATAAGAGSVRKGSSTYTGTMVANNARGTAAPGTAPAAAAPAAAPALGKGAAAVHVLGMLSFSFRRCLSGARCLATMSAGNEEKGHCSMRSERGHGGPVHQ